MYCNRQEGCLIVHVLNSLAGGWVGYVILILWEWSALLLCLSAVCVCVQMMATGGLCHLSSSMPQASCCRIHYSSALRLLVASVGILCYTDYLLFLDNYLMKVQTRAKLILMMYSFLPLSLFLSLLGSLKCFLGCFGCACNLCFFAILSSFLFMAAIPFGISRAFRCLGGGRARAVHNLLSELLQLNFLCAEKCDLAAGLLKVVSSAPLLCCYAAAKVKYLSCWIIDEMSRFWICLHCCCSLYSKCVVTVYPN